MATGNSAPAAPSAHPDTEWQVARDISTLVAGNDTGLSPCFVVVSPLRGRVVPREPVQTRCFCRALRMPSSQITDCGRGSVPWKISEFSEKHSAADILLDERNMHDFCRNNGCF